MDRTRKVDTKRTLSLESGIDNVINDTKKKDAASKYLQDVLGDVLEAVLSDCSKKRPPDPIIFIADAFKQ